MENEISQKKYCHGCGYALHVTATQCPNCGATFYINKRSKTTAGWFAFLIGGIGAHRFYLGENSIGILYILFCWTWIPGIIAFFEAINYWVMSQEEFDKKYNRN